MRSKNDLHEKFHLDPDLLPSHVAIIMDGNGRWAKKRLLNRIIGHETGVKTVREIVRAARKIGIFYLTLYAFSTENWSRPKIEIDALMKLLKSFLISERKELTENNIKLKAIGRKNRLPGNIKKELLKTEELTQNNTKMTLNLALSYGSRTEIINMVQKISEQVNKGSIDSKDITEKIISENLYTKGQPDPDLLIRTSGEMRISNFLLWQIAYSEIYFTNTLWPDFTTEEFYNIIKEYQSRERRFGKV